MSWQQVFEISMYHGYIPQILLAEILFSFRLKRRSHFWWRVGIGLPICLFLALVIPNLIAMVTPGFFSITIFLITYAFWLFLFDNKWSDVLFCCVSAQFTQNLSYNCENLFLLTTGIETNMVGSVAISVSMMLLVYSLCWFFFARRIREIRLSGHHILLLAVSTGLFVYLMQYLFQHYEIDTYWVSRLPLIVCCVFGLGMQYFLLAYKDEQAENDQLEFFLSQENKKYDMLKSSIDLINMKAHDLKHHIQQFNLSKTQENEEISEISSIVENYEQMVQCGNPTLDVILTEKKYQCDVNKIPFSMMVEGEAFLFMRSTDLVAIFANALVNAIECELSIPEVSKRCVALKAVRLGNMLTIHVENYCVRQVLMKDGLPVTNKSDNNYHGFGTKSIRYAVRKYGGALKITQENDLFLLNIVIPCPEEKQ